MEEEVVIDVVSDASCKLTVDVIAVIFDFLFPVDQWSLRSTSRRFRDATDLVCSTLFYPFVILRKGQRGVVGTFSFSRQEALLLQCTTTTFKKRIMHGKARRVEYPDVDTLMENVADIMLTMAPNRVVASADESTFTDTAAGGPITLTKLYQRDEHEASTSTRPIVVFVFCEEHDSAVLNLLKGSLARKLLRSDAPTRRISSVSLILDDWIPKGSLKYPHPHCNFVSPEAEVFLPQQGNQESELDDQQHALTATSLDRLQCLAHFAIMRCVASSQSAREIEALTNGAKSAAPIPQVPGYTCYYGQGAHLFLHCEAVALFGCRLDESKRFEDVRSSSDESRRNRMVSWSDCARFDVEALCGMQPESVIDPKRMAGRPLLLKQQTPLYNPETFTSTLAQRYGSNGYLHVGTTLQGAEAIVALTDVVNSVPAKYFSLAHTTDVNDHDLYIADNTFFAERYDEDFLLPTLFLRNVWGRSALRDKEAEANAPCIFGRPLTAPWILWGPPDTCSSPHVEPSGSYVWVHLFRGEKLWAVFNDGSQSWEVFSQHEHETVFMPCDVWHVVKNVGSENFAIAQNYIPRKRKE